MHPSIGHCALANCLELPFLVLNFPYYFYIAFILYLAYSQQFGFVKLFILLK